jgi:hypothetical protein
MLARKNTVLCAACGYELQARAWRPVPGLLVGYAPMWVRHCPEHPTFPLAFKHDEDGELSIVRLEPLPPWPAPVIELGDITRIVE